MQFNWPILSVLIWLPIIGGVALLLLGERGIAVGRWVALITTAVTFGISTLLYTNFDATTAEMQFVEKLTWIPTFNAWYALGVDGIAMPLIILTTFVTPLVIIAAWNVIEKRPAQYFSAFLILEGLMVGVFAATDALLFYVLWEAMLIPMFIIIGVWGGARRVYATLKFFLYTFLGSVLMLVSLIFMYLKTCDAGQCSYAIADFQELPLALNAQLLIFVSFMVAFAVKVPMWPVHTWLPDAHVEAPTGGSVILAAIMLKMGGYGFLRFSLPITPDASAELDWLVISLSLIAVVYIGFVALVQKDMKKLIAYSSIAHMGFVTLGSFLAFELLRVNGDVRGAAMGIDGAMVQMISHGLVSGAMFFCV
ncbi:MAG: NuoM family protein, partial [Povalibacter sp.]